MKIVTMDDVRPIWYIIHYVHGTGVVEILFATTDGY